jgi:capsular exopolysaccharide synthesis family protein
MVEDLQKNLGAGPVRGTNLFQLSWKTSDKNDVPVVLNQIADTYIALRREIESLDYDDNKRLFELLISETENAILDKSSVIETFIKERGIVTLDDTRHSQIALSLNDLPSRINAAESELAFAASSLEITEGKLRGTLEPTEEDRFLAEQSPLIQAINATITEAEIDYRVAREKFNPDHTQVIALEQRLRPARSAKEDELDKILMQTLSGEYKLLQNQMANTTRMLDKLSTEYERKDTELREMSSAMAEYKALESSRDRLHDQREAREKMLDELLLLESRSDADRVDIFQRSELPREKSFPKMFVVIPLATLLVVGLTVGLVFLRELTDKRIKSVADLSIIPNARVLGVVPDLDDDPTKCKRAELVVLDNPQSVLAESYRQTATPIRKSMEHAQHRSLLLVGGLPGAGTTTLAANLAASAASTGQRVIVIDANYRRPRLGSLMGASDDGIGLGDVLTENAKLDEVIVAGNGVDVIGTGTAANRLSERFSHTAFGSLMAELRDRYDLVIIDAPPAVVAGDAMIIASKVDAAALVLRAYQEHRGLASRLLHQISDTGCDLLGIILNRPRGTAGGYFKKNFETMAAYGRKR